MRSGPNMPRPWSVTGAFRPPTRLPDCVTSDVGPGVACRGPGRQTASMTSAEDERITFGLPADDAEIIRSAADAEGLSLELFAVESMRRYAREVLADRRLFRVSETAWAELDAMLQAPPTDNPRLRKLLDEEPGQE
ncbi:Protein of unknown function DUF1778 [Parafrankia sp. EAN1pec]|nr:Protein of unknown function DUF1778 [Frankia sp. EAN1pec]